mmetsp:Transcript_137876/g.239666  ORF Transcript_137876/g.239666 Transcript_137876/m.239666 type:complete len:235 (-) Transcript_137876:466-1170(-)
MVNGENLKSILISANEAGLLSAVTRSSCAHDAGLDKHTRSTVRVRSILRVDGGERDGILVILSQVEMAREPSLDAPMLAHQLDELAAPFLVTVVQPTATVDYMVFLENAQPRPIGRGMCENKDLPAFRTGVVFKDLLKPCNLCIINGNLVRSVLGISENGASKPDTKSLIGNLAHELRGGLPVLPHKDLKVLLIGLEFVESLQIMVPPDHFVRDTKAPEELCCQLVAFGGTCKQ